MKLTSTLTWVSCSFDELNVRQLYAILQLRQDVFIVEQNCIYQDIDDLDLHSQHVFAQDNAGFVYAYARLVPPGRKYKEPSIGRVVLAKKARGLRLGAKLMTESLAVSARLYPEAGNRISAQAHLRAFYESLGFASVSDEYDEDGIPHIEMLRP